MNGDCSGVQRLFHCWEFWVYRKSELKVQRAPVYCTLPCSRLSLPYWIVLVWCIHESGGANVDTVLTTEDHCFWPLGLTSNVVWWYVPVTVVYRLVSQPCRSPHASPGTHSNCRLFTVPVVRFAFLECHLFGIILFVAFLNWYLSLSSMHLRFLHIFSWFDNFLFYFGKNTYI